MAAQSPHSLRNPRQKVRALRSAVPFLSRTRRSWTGDRSRSEALARSSRSRLTRSPEGSPKENTQSWSQRLQARRCRAGKATQLRSPPVPHPPRGSAGREAASGRGEAPVRSRAEQGLPPARGAAGAGAASGVRGTDGGEEGLRRRGGCAVPRAAQGTAVCRRAARAGKAFLSLGSPACPALCGVGWRRGGLIPRLLGR